jgi:hypothetical protein
VQAGSTGNTSDVFRKCQVRIIHDIIFLSFSDSFLTKTWEAFLVSITRATLLYRSMSVFTSRFSLRQLYSSIKRWTSPLLDLQEERDVSRIRDASRPMDCRENTTRTVQVLISWEEFSRDVGSCFVYTTPRINEQNHNMTESTSWYRWYLFPFTFVPVTDNDGRKCKFSYEDSW